MNEPRNRRAGDRSLIIARVSARACSAMATIVVIFGYVSLGEYMAAAGLCGCAGLAVTGGLKANACKPD